MTDPSGSAQSAPVSMGASPVNAEYKAAADAVLAAVPDNSGQIGTMPYNILKIEAQNHETLRSHDEIILIVGSEITELGEIVRCALFAKTSTPTAPSHYPT